MKNNAQFYQNNSLSVHGFTISDRLHDFYQETQ